MNETSSGNFTNRIGDLHAYNRFDIVGLNQNVKSMKQKTQKKHSNIMKRTNTFTLGNNTLESFTGAVSINGWLIQKTSGNTCSILVCTCWQTFDFKTQFLKRTTPQNLSWQFVQAHLNKKLHEWSKKILDINPCRNLSIKMYWSNIW